MIYKFETLASTSDYLKENFNKYNEFDVIRANLQTKGRSRRGNTWYSNEGMALFTFYIENIKNLLIMPILIGYSVLRAIEDITNIDLFFKWTNDVYLNNKKLLGILCENVDNKLFVGIGINVNNNVHENVKDIAISLKEYTKKEFDIDEIINKIINNVKKLNNENIDNIIDYLNKKNYLYNKKISIKIGNKKIDAIAKNISNDGRLEIITNDNEKILLGIGEIFEK